MMKRRVAAILLALCLALSAVRPPGPARQRNDAAGAAGADGIPAR